MTQTLNFKSSVDIISTVKKSKKSELDKGAKKNLVDEVWALFGWS